jgi:LPS-assembly lipoprotein
VSGDGTWGKVVALFHGTQVMSVGYWIASRALLAACSLVLLAGCGFQLRTWDLSSNVESFYLEVVGSNPLQSSLQRAMEQAGVVPAESASAAQVVVRLLDVRRSRRAISVTSRARVAEYELRLDVLYGVRAEGKQLLTPQWARSTRVFRVDRDNLVGSNEEQALLEREMQSDLVQQVVRAVNAVTMDVVDAA